MNNFLSQFDAPVQNRVMVEIVIAACGLELAGFLTNEDLELYYNISRGGHDMGYISKGWDDPGFRIGDLILLKEGQKDDAARACSKEILNHCAVNGIAVTAEMRDDIYELALDGVIYTEGFNKATFIKTLETLNECAEKVRALLSVQE